MWCGHWEMATQTGDKWHCAANMWVSNQSLSDNSNVSNAVATGGTNSGAKPRMHAKCFVNFPKQWKQCDESKHFTTNFKYNFTCAGCESPKTSAAWEHANGA